MLCVVAYDIVDDGTRKLVADEMKNWGHRVQYSVFECDLNERRSMELKERLDSLVSSEDSIRIYRICQACRPRCIAINGRGFVTDQPFYEV